MGTFEGVVVVGSSEGVVVGASEGEADGVEDGRVVGTVVGRAVGGAVFSGASSVSTLRTVRPSNSKSDPS